MQVRFWSCVGGAQSLLLLVPSWFSNSSGNSLSIARPLVVSIAFSTVFASRSCHRLLRRMQCYARITASRAIDALVMIVQSKDGSVSVQRPILPPLTSALCVLCIGLSCCAREQVVASMHVSVFTFLAPHEVVDCGLGNNSVHALCSRCMLAAVSKTWSARLKGQRILLAASLARLRRAVLWRNERNMEVRMNSACVASLSVGRGGTWCRIIFHSNST
jgi:hypothetical protein